ncbi:unnamed protein product, partial [Didymodactylos carnosus]
MSSASRIVQLSADRVSHSPSTCGTSSFAQEQAIADHLFDILNSILTSDSYTHDYDTTLDHSIPDSELKGCEEDTDISTTDPDFEEKDTEAPIFENFSLNYMKRAVEYYDIRDPITGKRKHSWSNVKHQFQRIPYQYYLARFREYVEQSGSKKQKTESLEDFVYDKFENARDLLRPVYDIDSKRWAHQCAREMPINDFTASDHSISNFKHKHDICSRKITKVVTKRESTTSEEIEKSVDDFVREVRALLPKYHNVDVLNTDQMGMELEVHSTRTLSYQGEKTTASSVFEYWRDHVLVPAISSLRKVLLLSDSGSGQGDRKGIYEKMKGVKRMEIPPKTTPKIQPLD